MPKVQPFIALLLFCTFLPTCQKEHPDTGKISTAAQNRAAESDPESLHADSLLDALQYQTAIPAYQALEERHQREAAWEPFVACRRKRAFCLWASRESEQAVALCNETLPLAQEHLGENHPEIANLLTILGNVHADKRTEADFNASCNYFQQALAIRKQNFPEKSPELAGAYERLGITHWLIDDCAGALPYYEKALTCLDTLRPDNARTYLKVYNNLGLYYYTTGNYRKALVYFNQCYAIARDYIGKKGSRTVKSLINIGQCHNGLGDPDEALDRLREAWAIETEIAEPHDELRFLTLGAMAESYIAKEDYNQAAGLLRQTLSYWRPDYRDDVNGLSSDLMSLGNVYLKKQDTDSALLYLRRAWKIVEENYDSTSFNRVKVLNLLGQTFQRRGDHAGARQLYEQALRIALSKAGEHHPTTGDLKRRLAELFFETGALDDAFRQAGEAHRSFLNREATDIGTPKITQINSLTDLIDVKGLTGNILAAQFEKNRDTNALRQSVLYFRQAIALSDSLKTALTSAPARQMAQKQVHKLAEDALQSLYQLWTANPAPEYLEQAFFFMEKSRAAELLASLQEIDAKHSAGIPEAWLERETFLKSQVSSYQRWLNAPERLEHPAEASQVARFERQYVQAKQQLDTFLQHLEKQFPRYHHLKYNYSTASLSDVQAFTARRHSQCVEYFYGKKTLCAFVIAGNTVHWKQLALPGMSAPPEAEQRNALLNRFFKLLTDKNLQEADPDNYFSTAFALKQYLLPDSLLNPEFTLIIIPDGRLCVLPFEALLSAPFRGGYGAAPYLIKSHAIYYGWSGTLLIAEPGNYKRAKNLLQVAPFLMETRDSLPPLPYSLRERPPNAPGALLEGRQAMADAFLREAPGFYALHLSTHAQARPHAAPGIELYDRTVTVPEIYAQHFNASLVSLSACETGAGVFAEGEGVLSLARAFAYAGARSLVASLWPVNERSTADLFTAFYRHLENGQPKSGALRQAKLDLLARPGIDARKAPYYWAAFTLSGADGKVDLDGDWPGKNLLLWVGLFAVVLFVFYSRFRRS